MARKLPIFIMLAAGALLSGCVLAGGGGNGIAEDLSATSSPEDLVYARYPQILNLEGTLDRASTYFYFGDYDLSEATAKELMASIADLRALMPDPGLCEHLDYLESRTQCLLQRLSDDTIEREAACQLNAALDSIGRTIVVEDEIEIEMNYKTKYWIRYFEGSGRRHFAKWLTRAGELRDVVEPILTEVGLPRDLLYLAIIESGLNLHARSRMRAIGPWQFMAGTAKLFGLRVNWWIDERKDIIASTYAAANYMKYLYELFGSWPLALAAYNAGEHRVAYAMTRQRTNNYWRLRLPAQTSWFVPKFMAALAIGRNPEAFGFSKSTDDPIAFDLIEVKRSTELGDIAAAAGCSLSEIKSLNPHLKKWATPPDMVVEVKVPKGSGERCLDELARMPQKKLVSWIKHKVVRGETLSRIAATYEVSVEELKRVNEIKSARLLHAGNILLIPVKDKQLASSIASRPSYRTPRPHSDNIVVPKFDPVAGSVRETLDDADRNADIAGPPPDAETGECIIHVVKRGETLSAIGRRYGKSIMEILAWNQGISRNRIHPGDKIRIMVESD